MSIPFKKKHLLSEENFEIVYKNYYSRLYYYSFQFIADEETSKNILKYVF